MFLLCIPIDLNPWVTLASKKHISTDSTTGEDWLQGYCFQFWRGRHNTFRFCGANGQMCVVSPDTDSIFAVQSGYNNTEIHYILDKYYDNVLTQFQGSALCEDAETYRKLNELNESLTLPFVYSGNSPIEPSVNGKEFDISCGEYNRIRFEFDNDKCIVSLFGKDKCDVFFAGFKKPEFSEVLQTHFVNIDSVDNERIFATACWETNCVLKIKARVINTPALLFVECDFSNDNVNIYTKRGKFDIK